MFSKTKERFRIYCEHLVAVCLDVFNQIINMSRHKHKKKANEIMLIISRGRRARLQRHLLDARWNPALHHQRHGHLHLPPASRRVRRHCPLQLPRHDPSVDVPHGHGVRQHLPAEAFRACAHLCHAACQDAAGCWRTGRHTKYHPWPTCWWDVKPWNCSKWQSSSASLCRSLATLYSAIDPLFCSCELHLWPSSHQSHQLRWLKSSWRVYLWERI